MKRFLRKWGFPILMGVALLATGIITGWWAPLVLSGYLLGSFAVWANRRRRFAIASIIVLTMIPSLDNKIKALEKWRKEAPREVIKQAQAFEAEILDYNTEEQLYRQGQYATGKPVVPPYAPLTVEIKRAKSQPTGRVTLRDTGDFHESFTVVWRDEEFEITATDVKTKKLVRDYGPEIFGLDSDGMKELISQLRPALLERLKNQIV